MPELLTIQDQFPRQTIITNDGDDTIEWDVQISWEDEERLNSCVMPEFIGTGENSSRRQYVDQVKAIHIGLDCVTGWRGVTQNGQPIPWAKDYFAAIPQAHRVQFGDALCFYAMVRSFPNRYLPPEQTAAQETGQDSSSPGSETQETPDGS